jgi:hypothetical protein
MKKSRLFTVGALALALVFGLALVGCGDKDSGDPTSPGGNGTENGNGTEGGDEDNAFVGEWTGTVLYNGQEKAATITFTTTAWTLVCAEHSINETGTYTLVNNSTANLVKGSSPFGNAMIMDGTLAGTLNNSAVLSFTK